MATLVLGDEPDRYVTYSIDGVSMITFESNRGRSEATVRLDGVDGQVTTLHLELAESGELHGEH